MYFIFSGLIIEFGSVCTVLVASNLGIPISTTHCLVGAVILVGLVRSRHVTEWKVFFNILIAWLVTVPVSGNVCIVYDFLQINLKLAISKTRSTEQ
jgi:sodium-dependent phosphate transporter